MIVASLRSFCQHVVGLDGAPPLLLTLQPCLLHCCCRLQQLRLSPCWHQVGLLDVTAAEGRTCLDSSCRATQLGQQVGRD